MRRLAVYGHTIGIVMQKDDLFRLPGDVGNATTFPFPVRYKLVNGVRPDDLKNPELALRHKASFVQAAKKLEEEGVRAITGGCGYLAIYQKVLSRAVAIPVFTSSLLQVPMVSSLLRRGQKVGIITADAQALSEDYFEAVGWSSRTIPIAVAGMDSEAFRALQDSEETIEHVAKRREALVVGLARELVRKNPDVGAIVLECTNFPPHTGAIQDAVRLPVFDLITLIHWVHNAFVCQRHRGYL